MVTIYKISIAIVKYTFLFWLAETLIFMLIEGWHYSATSDIEKRLDFISEIGFGIGFFLYSVAVTRWVDKQIRKENNN